jgi:hypothetical protein
LLNREGLRELNRGNAVNSFRLTAKAQRLQAEIANNRALPLEESVDLLIKTILTWRGDEHLSDDISIVETEII